MLRKGFFEYFFERSLVHSELKIDNGLTSNYRDNAALKKINWGYCLCEIFSYYWFS